MNPALSRIATVKASRLTTRLCRRFNIKSSPIAPDLLTLFEVIGYTVFLEADIKIGRHKAQRSSDAEVILSNCLRNALKQINPKVPCEVIETVISGLISTHSSNLLENNRRFHKLLTDGVDVVYHNGDQIIHDKVWLLDSSNLLSNDWLVIHGFTIVEECHSHCLDVVVFINGLPLAVIVWSHSRHEKATFWKAYQRLQMYQQQIPNLFSYNVFQVMIVENLARVGTLTSQWQEFLPWRTIEDFSYAGETELEVLIQGIFDKRRFLELVQHFIVFEETGASICKNLLRHPFCTIHNPKSPSRMI
ncbi:type I restriction endonuclease [Brasilonema sp. UFV-L1]|uniref:type I restriction endonuclease n=1 Tax=Brasilonema sp. UFV-L1 TaxID=2234130 RepID=UPI00145F7DF0|nr:type I restriction endonuclease [Brasilonema sp. UFV-L1]NMG06819.1 type I restriction endonuclease subunit R [Brasilonema sp. UFV-L1]